MVEAYGVKGVKSTSWAKAFKSVEAMNAWVEKNDAEVYGVSFQESNGLEHVFSSGHDRIFWDAAEGKYYDQATDLYLELSELAAFGIK